jgi:hypothetical protein
MRNGDLIEFREDDQSTGPFLVRYERGNYPLTVFREGEGSIRWSRGWHGRRLVSIIIDRPEY